MQSFLEPHFAELETKAAAEFHREGLTGVAARSVDLRYAGQGYELNIPFAATMLNDFHAAHRKRYGHADETRSVEAVNVRLRMIARSEQIKFPRGQRGPSKCDQAITKHKKVMFEGEWIDTPILQRDLLVPGNEFAGPAIVHEYSATTVVPPGCTVGVDEYSNFLVKV
jgi:N-methylhydantoinase A